MILKTFKILPVIIGSYNAPILTTPKQAVNQWTEETISLTNTNMVQKAYSGNAAIGQANIFRTSTASDKTTNNIYTIEMMDLCTSYLTPTSNEDVMQVQDDWGSPYFHILKTEKQGNYEVENSTEFFAKVRIPIYEDSYLGGALQADYKMCLFQTTNNEIEKLYSAETNICNDVRYQVFENNILNYGKTIQKFLFENINMQYDYTFKEIYENTNETFDENYDVFYLEDYTLPSTYASTNYYIIIGLPYWNNAYIETQYRNVSLYNTYSGNDTYYIAYREQTTAYEVVDIPGLCFDILTMPFSFMSQAFNFTLFPGTPYSINISNLLLTIIAILIFAFIIKLLVRYK